jgi:hemerythrin-like domain-containing protein
MRTSLLGNHVPSFDDPLALLYVCHGHTERQLLTLARLQRHLPEHGCDKDARAAARAILQYFDSAAPNHHADEEQSIFPRLAAAVPMAARLIATLDGDHAALAANWRRLRLMLAAIAAGARASLSAKLVADVTAAYLAHIAREENELFPLAHETFDAATLAAISREMARRRGVDPAKAPTPAT